jgi:hypothetical protein
VDRQARRSGTRGRRRWCNRGVVGLHAQVSAVAPNAPTDLPGSDSIRRPREGRLLGFTSCPGSESSRVLAVVLSIFTVGACGRSVTTRRYSTWKRATRSLAPC